MVITISSVAQVSDGTCLRKKKAKRKTNESNEMKNSSKLMNHYKCLELTTMIAVTAPIEAPAKTSDQ